ncbi:unnamed protein product [Cuscuta epithymum]|uniref:SBP-type domain-containing protein n=1 Tax=Cuscuta epithymum TaxID=186058 RepID=A0AAV0CJS4_9ASTE|nr:unnamed protein product [Cuscuta epithymum]
MKMEWDAKWGWEKLAMLGSNVCESPKKMQLAGWGLVDAAEVDPGSFGFSGEGGASSGSGVYGSSEKSSVSASTDSSLKKDGMDSSKFTSEGFPGDFEKKMEQSTAEVSVEPFIGLKLGKRTYFERNCGGNNVKSALMVKIPMPLTPVVKKPKSSSSQCAPIPYCQVEGCKIDLSSAKDYHQKHRVCDIHSKCSKVIIAGVERRFCQQCSRFHGLSEFDEKKRSCRRRLSDHNARRRKPLSGPTQFSYINGRPQMNFVNQFTLLPSRTTANSTWDNSCTPNMSKLQDMAGIRLPNAINASKGTISEVFDQGAKQSWFPSSGGTKLEVPRALSLLSSTSWGSYQPELISLDNHPPTLPAANQSSSVEPLMHSVPQSLLMSSPEYPQAEHHSTDFHGHTLAESTTSGGQVQLFKVPHDTDFYFN